MKIHTSDALLSFRIALFCKSEYPVPQFFVGLARVFNRIDSTGNWPAGKTEKNKGEHATFEFHGILLD